MEKAMAPHSSTLAWKIPWTAEPGRLQRLHIHFLLSCIGEGNGGPLQCSCLENPRDRGAWWASVYGVAQSRTRLSDLAAAAAAAGSKNDQGSYDLDTESKDSSACEEAQRGEGARG